MCLLQHLLLMLLLCASASRANFDLYLQKTEVKRTLGLDAELYYVREGILNDYALAYRVLVGAHIHRLYFTWKATAKKPVLYNVDIYVNETEEKGGGTVGTGTLATPMLNISFSGVIPIVESTFRLDLPCTGLTSAEVTVTLNINVTAPRPTLPPTELYIVRRKVCLQGQSGSVFLEQLSSSVEEEPSEEGPLSLLYYVISVLAALTLVLTIVFTVAALRNRRLKNKRHHILSSDAGMGVYECMRPESGNLLQQPEHRTLLQQPEHRGIESSSKHSTESSVGKTTNSYASLVTPRSTAYSTASSITAVSQASANKTPYQKGNHSTASTITAASQASANRTPYQKGNRTHERNVLQKLSRDGCSRGSSSRCGSNGDGSSRVTTCTSISLVKSELLLDPSIAHFKDTFTQCEVSRDHVRVSELLQEGGFGKVYRGCIQRNTGSVYDQQVIIKSLNNLAPGAEVVSLCREGLQLFNLHHRNLLPFTGIAFDDTSPPLLIYPYHDCHNLKLYLQEHQSGHLVAGELLELAVQAAHALCFLHQANLLHNDIAARNCRVSGNFQLVLCDAALSRNLFPKDYEGDPSRTLRPIKWMAYEAITDHIISSASDVWGYGVLLWELTTLAQQPYVEITACEMPDYLRDGYRLVQPQNCPDDLYKVMAYCWAIHASERPHVDLILDYLADFSKQLNNFV